MRTLFALQTLKRPRAALGRLGRMWHRLGVETGGSTLIVFALAFIPMVALVGLAVDYSRASAIRAAMQAAADATALAVSNDAYKGATTAQVQTNATTYFNASFTRKDASGISVVTTYTGSTDSQVIVAATATMKTDFMGVLGPSFRTWTLGVSSQTAWGNTRLRVALVLDVTGSMNSSSKLTALKNALTNTTNGLLTTLKNAAKNPGDVYVSIIPFVKDVTVSASSNYSADWIYWGTSAQDPTLSDNTSWDAINGSCSVSGNSPRSSCVQVGVCGASGTSGTSVTQSSCGSCSNPSETTQSNCTGQRACSKAGYGSQNSCTNNGGTWGYGTWTAHPETWSRAVWTPNNHSTWNGCLMDRGTATKPGTTAGNDENVTMPTSSDVTTLFPAEQYSSCATNYVMPLNYDWTGMTTFVNGMIANGSTNQAIGLVHGWQSLVGGGPYGTVPATSTQYKYQKVIILLSDGLNTQDRWYGNGSSTGTSDTDLIDAREQATCTGAKAQGITIYTVQVNTDNGPTSTLLRNCATDTSKFFLLTSSTQIVSTFAQIGTELAQLRVAK